MGGLWKPLDHEKHKRADKALAPDYRDNFQLPAFQNFPSLPNFFRFTKQGVKKTDAWYREYAKYWKLRIQQEVRRITNRHPFLIQKRKFAFKWTIEDFARENSITVVQAKNSFAVVTAEAQERRSMLERRLRGAAIEKKTEFDVEAGEQVVSFSIKFGSRDIADLFKFCSIQINDEFFAHQEPKEAKESANE